LLVVVPNPLAVVGISSAFGLLLEPVANEKAERETYGSQTCCLRCRLSYTPRAGGETVQANADQIEKLCTQIIAEKDPQKMALLAKQLEAVIVEREQKLRKSLDRGGNGLGRD